MKMLQAYTRDNSVKRDTMPPEFRSPVETLAEGMAFIRRQRSIITLTCLVTLVVALLYLVAAVPVFTASAELVIDSKPASGDAASASTIVESQIAIIRSEGVARAVIRKLGLAEDPDFTAQGVVRRMVRSMSRLLGWRKPETESSVLRYAIESFQRKLSVKRVGPSYIVEITFDSIDPERAAQILNTLAEIYIMAPMDAKYRSTSQGEKWFKDRTNELGNQASAAEKAVADFYKNKIGIADSSSAADAGTPPSQLTPSMQNELRELEATAEAAAKTYDNFVRAQRYMAAVQQQSSPTFEAHLLTDVSRPLTASSPKAGMVLGISTVGGVLLGIAIGLLRDLSGQRTAPARRSRESAAVPGIKANGSKSQFDGSPKIEKHHAYKESNLDC
jgi:uncharacterized protein involved in exopolysaccharide biosynthesis